MTVVDYDCHVVAPVHRAVSLPPGRNIAPYKRTYYYFIIIITNAVHTRACATAVRLHHHRKFPVQM